MLRPTFACQLFLGATRMCARVLQSFFIAFAIELVYYHLLGIPVERLLLSMFYTGLCWQFLSDQFFLFLFFGC